MMKAFSRPVVLHAQSCHYADKGAGRADGTVLRYELSLHTCNYSDLVAPTAKSLCQVDAMR